MIVGNLVAGKRIAQASGRELAHLEDSDQARKVLGGSWGAEGCVWHPRHRAGAESPFSVQFLFLADVLQWRAHTTPDHPLFLLLNAKVSAGLWRSFHFVISKSSLFLLGQ